MSISKIANAGLAIATIAVFAFVLSSCRGQSGIETPAVTESAQATSTEPPLTDQSTQDQATAEGEPETATPTIAASSQNADAIKDEISQFFEVMNVAGFRFAGSGLRELTFFVPTDEAISNLPEDYVEGLLVDPLAASRFLESHLVGRSLTQDDLASGITFFTINGHALNIEAENDTLFINGAEILGGRKFNDRAMIYLIDQSLITP